MNEMGADIHKVEQLNIDFPAEASTFHNNSFTKDGWVQCLVLVVIIVLFNARHHLWFLCSCVSRTDTPFSEASNVVVNELETAETPHQCCYRN